MPLFQMVHPSPAVSMCIPCLLDLPLENIENVSVGGNPFVASSTFNSLTMSKEVSTLNIFSV